jgi:CRISPR-associated protein Csd2
MAVATEEEAEKQSGDNRTMGRKATVPYALYRAHGFVSPALAERAEGRRVQGTGFSEEDLSLLWTALENMFEHDRSAARGLMSTRALVIFEHDSRLGARPSHELFGRVRAARKADVPRSFDDYEITLDGVSVKGVRTVVPVTGGHADS